MKLRFWTSICGAIKMVSMRNSFQSFLFGWWDAFVAWLWVKIGTGNRRRDFINFPLLVLWTSHGYFFLWTNFYANFHLLNSEQLQNRFKHWNKWYERRRVWISRLRYVLLLRYSVVLVSVSWYCTTILFAWKSICWVSILFAFSKGKVWDLESWALNPNMMSMFLVALAKDATVLGAAREIISSANLSGAGWSVWNCLSIFLEDTTLLDITVTYFVTCDGCQDITICKINTYCSRLLIVYCAIYICLGNRFIIDCSIKIFCSGSWVINCTLSTFCASRLITRGSNPIHRVVLWPWRSQRFSSVSFAFWLDR